MMELALQVFQEQRKWNWTASPADKRIYGIADKIGTLDMKGEIHVYQDMNNQGEKVHIMLKDFTYGFMLTHIENFAKVTLR